MKKLWITIIVFVSIASNLQAINIDFIKFPFQHKNSNFDYYSKVNDYKILASSSKILILKNESTLLEKDLPDGTKIELENENAYDFFAYFNELGSTKFRTYKKINFYCNSTSPFATIEIDPDMIDIHFYEEQKQINLSENPTKNSKKILNSNSILWSTIYGGNQDEAFSSIIYDKNNYVYASGFTKSNF